MQVTKHFDDFIAKNQLFTKNQVVLVAVSGGVDSMVLLHLMQKAGYKIAVAHCNFQLRGPEADGDEAFVAQYCKKHKITLHAESFNTKDVAKQTGESIQMAARRLRYDWFDAILLTHGYNCVATAHHANDVAETFFVNLSRGTGLTGLTGIKPKMGNVVRPMLYMAKAEVEDYAKAHKLKWRDDSSNQSTKYRRNLIRHKVIPVFEKINPAFGSSIIKTISRLEQSNTLLKNIIDGQLADILTENAGSIFIKIKKLKALQPLNLYLFELLNAYGFNSDQIDDIEQTINRQPGQIFIADEYTLSHNRDFLILQPKKEKQPDREYLIDDKFSTPALPIKLTFAKKTFSKSIKLKQPPTVALLDFDAIKFPLVLRRPKTGDRFYPFGMTKSKLLSDFFKDSKLTKPEKDDAWVLTSNGKIVWVVGYRNDNRFAVTEKTKMVVKITLNG